MFVSGILNNWWDGGGWDWWKCRDHCRIFLVEPSPEKQHSPIPIEVHRFDISHLFQTMRHVQEEAGDKEDKTGGAKMFLIAQSFFFTIR